MIILDMIAICMYVAFLLKKNIIVLFRLIDLSIIYTVNKLLDLYVILELFFYVLLSLMFGTIIGLFVTGFLSGFFYLFLYIEKY